VIGCLWLSKKTTPSWKLACAASVRAMICVLAISGTVAHAAQSDSIDSVELEGVTQFVQTDLENLIEIGVGERADPLRISKTTENLKQFYRSKGFERMRVFARIDTRKKDKGAGVERVIVFQVIEGPVSQIAQFSIEVTPGKYQKRGNAILAKSNLEKGMRLDRERLANAARLVQDQFASLGFFSVKVLETKVVPTKVKAESLAKESEDSQFVDVSFVVSTGDRVQFGFRGNAVLTTQDLLGFVEDERQLGLGEDYIGKVLGRLKLEYERRGFTRAVVNAFSFEAEKDGIRRVRYEINEGPIVKIRNITFEGNSFFFESELKKKLFKSAGPLLKQRIYALKELEQATEVLSEWCRTQGFLSAKISSIQKIDQSASRVDLVIYLLEGERTMVQEIQFEGLRYFKESKLLDLLGLKKLEPFNIYAFNDGVERVESLFREEGFWDAKIENIEDANLVRYESDNHFAYIQLKISEGEQIRVGTVSVSGTRKTKPATVIREMLLESGDILRESELIFSEQRLRRLGVFASVKIEQIETKDRAVRDLVIQVEEASPGVLSGGIGGRNDLGARVFSQVSYANLMGKNHTVSFQINANRRFNALGGEYCANERQIRENPTKDWCFIEFDSQLSYLYPWFLGRDLKFRPSVSISRTQFVRFDADTLATSVSISKRFARYQPLSLALTYSLERTNQYNANNDIDNQKLRIGAFIPAIVFDLRNSDIAPTKGIYSTLTYELARPEFLSQNTPFPVSYQRTQGRIDGYVPGPFQSVGYLSFRTGLESNFSKPPPGQENDPRYSIPLIKQFTLGGVSSLRGFREQSLVIPDDIAVAGYASYVNYRAQVDVPFTGSIRIGPFLDAANLNVDSYNMTKLRYGTGVGLKYMSPLGPVNFDIGVNPRPKQGEDGYRIHFSIGTL